MASAEGQPERGVRLAGAAAALCQETGTRLFRYDRERLERRLELARHLLSESTAAAVDAEERAMGREAALAYAVASPSAIS